MERQKPQTIDAYMAPFPEEVKQLLQAVRGTIRKAAPGAEEKISYGIPTFALNGNLVHFAAFKSHIGFYSVPTALQAFKKDLAPYHSAKGSVRFPIGRPLPLDLITRIVRYRLKENEALAAKKKSKVKSKK